MCVPGLARVSTDNTEIGKVAADHFLERGLRRFAFCGYDRNDWSGERGQGFIDRLATAGHSCTAEFHAGVGQIYVKAIIDDLARWIDSLPKPIAIFACHDRVAMLLAKTCQYLHVPVPEDVAILGVDDDPLEGGFSSPPLSSVIGSARRVGYEAAALLDKMMRGQPIESKVITVPPAGIAVRRSTDVLTVDDADVAAALRYIRDHATDPVEVSDLVTDLQISRRNLERKFRSLLNRTPYEEIRRVRLAHAKTLLLGTHRSILDVALDSGFPSASTFSAVFNRETGLSPRVFRKLYRSRAGREADTQGSASKETRTK
jgi:LacI family transcriptional regulator